MIRSRTPAQAVLDSLYYSTMGSFVCTPYKISNCSTPRPHSLRLSLSNRRAQSRDLLLHSRSAGAAESRLHLHRALVVKHLEHVVAHPRVDVLQLRHGELVHGLLLLLRERDHTACDVVGFTEREAWRLLVSTIVYRQIKDVTYRDGQDIPQDQ